MRQADFHRVFLGTSSKIMAFLLVFFGILSSGCDNSAAPTYGPPGTTLTLSGTVRSQSDSTTVKGIEIRVGTTDSISLAPFTSTDQNGQYQVFSDDVMLQFSDSVEVIALDVDGELNGRFWNTDTTVVIPSEEEPEIIMDLYLKERGN